MNDVSPSAIEAVYVETYPRLYAYAWHHLPPDAVEDALQDAWTYVLSRGTADIANLGGYVYLKLGAVIADYYRKRGRCMLVDIDAVALACDQRETVDNWLAASDDLQHVQEVLGMLGAKQRAALEKVITAETALSPNDRANVYRARQRLRAALSED